MAKIVVPPTFFRRSIGDHAQLSPTPIGDHVQLFRDHAQLNPGRKQRSVIDAVLLLLNNIQSKNNRRKARQRIAIILFLDIKGAFDHILAN